MTANDRKSARLDSDQFISYRLYDSENRVCDEGMAKTKDISRNGVSIESRTPFEADARVDLTIALTNELIKTEGVVRNVTKTDENTYNIGIEFTEITDAEIEMLTKEFPDLMS